MDNLVDVVWSPIYDVGVVCLLIKVDMGDILGSSISTVTARPPLGTRWCLSLSKCMCVCAGVCFWACVFVLKTRFPNAVAEWCQENVAGCCGFNCKPIRVNHIIRWIIWKTIFILGSQGLNVLGWTNSTANYASSCGFSQNFNLSQSVN